MFYLGLDLGQQQDHTAIVVVERSGIERDVFRVRFAERAALGTPYPRVVRRVGAIIGSLALSDGCSLIVDATGVGAPVVDLLRAARLRCDFYPVTIIAGERTSCSASLSGSKWHVPKQDLLAGLQVLLENGELKIAKELKELASLTRELMDVKAVSGLAGRMRLGADGPQQHDDLVIALALACWGARLPRIGFVSQRLI